MPHIISQFLLFHGLDVLPASVLKRVKRHGSASLLCKCGKFRRINKSGVIYAPCGDKICHCMYGINRPQHAAIMAEYARGGKFPVLRKKGDHNPYLNSMKFKIKILQNNGFNCETMTDDELQSVYNNLVSISARKKETILAKSITLYEKYKDIYDLHEIPRQILCSADTSTLKKYNRTLNSIQSIESGTGCAKRFKRILMTNFQSKITPAENVLTRSSYEANYINFFEREKIPWDYETEKVVCDNSGKTYYVPDFTFCYGGVTYMLEVKGYLVDENQYVNNKLKYALDYCIKNNMVLLFTYDGRPSSIEQLIKQKVHLQ